MICIYHNRDFDGFCSAAIVKRKYPDAKFIGWDYGMPIPELPENEPIIMVDISFPMQQMYEIAKKSGHNIIWIDHHISAINDYREFKKDRFPFCQAVLDNKHAACELTWKFFFDTPMPDIVELLGIYDSWRMKDDPIWDNCIMPIQYGLKLKCNSLDTFPMQTLESNIPLNKIFEEGQIVLRYQEMQNEARCNNSSFEREFEGLKAICLVGIIGSQAFKSAWDTGKYDIMIAASYTKDRWTISLYTEKPEIDVSEICKKYGGGGHRGAAGFVTQDISVII